MVSLAVDKTSVQFPTRAVRGRGGQQTGTGFRSRFPVKETCRPWQFVHSPCLLLPWSPRGGCQPGDRHPSLVVLRLAFSLYPTPASLPERREKGMIYPLSFPQSSSVLHFSSTLHALGRQNHTEHRTVATKLQIFSKAQTRSYFQDRDLPSVLWIIISEQWIKGSRMTEYTLKKTKQALDIYFKY